MDLWSEASHDYDAERRARNLEMAKAASQGTWAFLALAQSPEEFGDRVALASDQIMTTAAEHGLDMRELTDVFTQRFALLMEAKDNPFADDSDDSDGSDSDDDSQDDSSDDSDDGDDDSDDDSSDDDSDSDSDSDDEDGDDSDSSDDSSDDGDDAKGKSQQGFQPFASRYAALASRINAGEDPLTWGGAPFARSSARKEAADGAAGPVTDVNTPHPESGGLPADPGVPGMNGGIAESTKPRQLPGGAAPAAPGMGMDAIADPMMDQQFDPAMNGGDIQQGADDLPPAQSSKIRARKVAAIAREVRKYNPTLSGPRCWKVAEKVYDQYLSKHAEDMSPLLFGDRGDVPDGPATHKVKTWSPPNLQPPSPGGGAEGGGGGGGPKKPMGLPGAGIGTAAEEAAAGAATAEGAGLAAEMAGAARMLPLLAL